MAHLEARLRHLAAWLPGLRHSRLTGQWSKQLYWPKDSKHLYTDERQVRGVFALAALRCSPRRAEILKDRLAQIRNDLGLGAEMKWGKVSKKYLPAYKAWVDVFLDDRYARLFLARFDKSSPYWQKWRLESRGKEIFRAYFAFLLRVVPVNTPCWVWADRISAKNWRWGSVQYLLNRKRQNDWLGKGRNLRQFLPVDSRRHDLLQLVDVLLGALDSQDKAVESPARQSLGQYVREHINSRVKFLSME